MERLDETLAQLATSIVAAPDSTAPRRVLGDLLLERGHPLGELIQLDLAGHMTRRWFDLLAEHEGPFAALVAPAADAAWLHRGLPEVAWFRSRPLLQTAPPRLPFLRQVAVRVAAGELAEVLQHATLRHVTELELTCEREGEPLGPGALPAALRTLTLVDADWRTLAPRLGAVRSSLRVLRLATTQPGPPADALAAVLDAQLSLDELELDGFDLSDAAVPLGRAARALGLRQLVLRAYGAERAADLTPAALLQEAATPGLALLLLGPGVGGGDSFGVRSGPACFGAPAKTSSGEDVIEQLGSDFVLDGFATPHGHAVSLAPQLRRGSGDDALRGLSFVREARAAHVGGSPAFAQVRARGFCEAAPHVTLEDVDGALLLPTALRRPLGLSRALLSALAALAEGLDEAAPGRLASDGVVLTEDARLRVVSAFGRPPHPRGEEFGVRAAAGYSKEAARGGPATERSDAYAVALLGYAAICGQLPQRDLKSGYTVVSGTLKDDFVPLDERAPVPALLSGAVQRALRCELGLAALRQALLEASATAPDLPLALPSDAPRPAFTLWPTWRANVEQLT